MRAVLAAAVALLAEPAAAACKLALVLGLDVSSSVNSREYEIQIGALARAFRLAPVREAILTPPGAGVAVYAFEWSGAGHQAEIAPWTMLDGPSAIDAFADRLDAHARSADDGRTAIGRALEFAADRLAEAPPCARRTIDLSGDGINNDGPGPRAVRATGRLDGVTINGLAIQGAADDPAIHYRAEVMQGEDAFVALARDFADYPPVIVGKLLKEIGDAMILGRAR